MKAKWIGTFTIKRMLILLVIMGGLAIGLLMITGLYANRILIDSQKRITQIVLPLDAAHQKVKMAIAAFIERKYQITEADRLDTLPKYEDREHLQRAFKESLSILKNKSKQLNKSAVNAQIKKIEMQYAEMLKNDETIFKAVRNRLELKEKIEVQMAYMDEIDAKFQESITSLINDLGKIIEEYSSSVAEEAPVATIMSTPNLNDTLISINNIQLAVSNIIGYGRQIILISEAESIYHIKDILIVNATERLKTAIQGLAVVWPKSSELMKRVGGVETDFIDLKNCVAEGEGSIFALKLQLIDEKKKIDEEKTKLNQIAALLSNNMNNIQTIADDIRQQAEADAISIKEGANKIIYSVGFFAFISMLIFGAWIFNRIIRPINKAVDFADLISKGDLTAEIEKENDDEVGNMVSKLGEMAHNLNSLIGQVQRSGIQVTSSATELSATSKEQEAVMKTQVESTNKVARSVEEISRVSSELVETMQKVAKMSDQTADFAAKGQTDLANMEEAMRHMENASKSISAKLEAINEKATNITSVVTTITKVADQTNLLSLNAAIEAEKAGEYGRGFTVVAREIRRLADQTAVATLDIDQMVQEMQSAVSAGVMEMDAFIAEVQKSSENVGKISTQLTRIIEQVKALSPSFEGVNESMQYQSGNAQHINDSMMNLSEEMQQTVESLRESFLAIEQLNDAARGLQDEVSRFKLN